MVQLNSQKLFRSCINLIRQLAWLISLTSTINANLSTVVALFRHCLHCSLMSRLSRSGYAHYVHHVSGKNQLQPTFVMISSKSSTSAIFPAIRNVIPTGEHHMIPFTIFIMTSLNPTKNLTTVFPYKFMDHVTTKKSIHLHSHHLKHR